MVNAARVRRAPGFIERRYKVIVVAVSASNPHKGNQL
jgi:hypothetical protein